MGGKNSGRGGLPREMVRRILRLLALGGKTQKRIAREVGCNEKTVWVVKHGRHHTQQDEEPQEKRCPGCGGLMLASEAICRVCEMRRAGL